MSIVNRIREGVREEGLSWVLERVCRFGGINAVGRVIATQKAEFVAWANNPSRDTLVAVYDLDVSPLTFDAPWFFVGAELERRKRGLNFLEIVIVPGRNGGVRFEDDAYEKVVDRANRLWRLHNVLVASAQLMMPRPTVHVANSRAGARAHLKKAWNVYPDGYRVGRPLAFDAPQYAAVLSELNSSGLSSFFSGGEAGRKYVQNWRNKIKAAPRLVLVTLRQYAYMADRNSDLAVWLEFAESIDPSRYTVAFIPDTEAAFGPEMQELATKFPILREAAFSTYLRMAFYESAFLNMSTNCGPASLFVLNKHCRYAMFKNIVPTAPMSTEDRLRSYGFVPGENPRFATPLQKWVWEDDTVESLTREFEEFVARVERLGAPDVPALPPVQKAVEA